MTLKQKLAIGIATVGISLAAICGGCGTPSEDFSGDQTKWSQEKRDKWIREVWNPYCDKSNAKIEAEKTERKRKWNEFATEYNKQHQAQNNPPVNSQEDENLKRVLNIYTGILTRSGSDITSYEYMKRN